MNSGCKTLFVFGSTVVCGLVVLWYVYRHFYPPKKLGKWAVVKSLYIYPVKSCAGIKLDKVEIGKCGPLFDRAWVLVNSKGVFQTMRQLPKLALVQPSIEEMKYLCLDAPGMRTLKLDVDMDESNTEKKLLDIFTLHGEGLDCGDEAGIWFDEFLGKPGHRLFNGHGKNLKHRELKESPVWGDLAQDGDQMIFSDAGPVMMVSDDSLEAVNRELETPVDVRTFRPNVLIEGCPAFEEDLWNNVKIGNVLLRRFRHCTRCILATVDMDAGTLRENGEPLQTLRRIRSSKDLDKRYNQRPLLGDHFVVDKTGTVTVGDDVIVLA